MKRAVAILALALVGTAALVGLAGPLMSKVETPPYNVRRSEGAIEIRAYPSLTVATTVVEGSRGAAVNRGFRILADYIFGANEGGRKIAMTAPVLQGRASAAAHDPIDKKGDWTVRFLMPQSWPEATLPRPRDQRVTIASVPSATFAVIRFSGFWRDALLQRKTADLSAYIARAGLKAKGEPVYAFYNPPWTLPFMRRNEVMIEIDNPN